MYPSIITSFSYPQSSDRLDNPGHALLHRSTSSAVGQVQAFIGTLSSVSGTLLFDIRSPDSNGGGHIQTASKGGTGQTTFVKGDMLIASSSSVLTKLAVGTNGQVLSADSSTPTGVTWGAGAVPTTRVYSVAGTGGSASSLVAIWTKPSNISYAIIEVVGGGGGGAGSTTNAETCGGGGGGGYARKTVLGSALPVAASIVLGQGGTLGAGTGADGANGATTWFGSIVSASGGVGGVRGGDGGAGGIGSGGDINVNGSGGGIAQVDNGGGGGGGSYFGGGAKGRENGPGHSGTAFGGGGGGAASDGNDRDGGAGAPGAVIIYEY